MFYLIYHSTTSDTPYMVINTDLRYLWKDSITQFSDSTFHSLCDYDAGDSFERWFKSAKQNPSFTFLSTAESIADLQLDVQSNFPELLI